MTQQTGEKEEKDYSLVLAILLLVGAGGLFLFSMTPDSDSASSSAVIYTKKYEDNVNRHLMLTNQKMELQRQRMIVENNALAPDYHETKPEAAYHHSDAGVDLSGESHAYDVAKELGREERQDAAPLTPNEMIQKEIFNAQQHQEYSQAYKAEYARQFVANAAKHGWQVKLSDDYKVISVRPIRKPSTQMQLFNSAGGSAQ